MKCLLWKNNSFFTMIRKAEMTEGFSCCCAVGECTQKHLVKKDKMLHNKNTETFSTLTHKMQIRICSILRLSCKSQHQINLIKLKRSRKRYWIKQGNVLFKIIKWTTPYISGAKMLNLLKELRKIIFFF